MLESKKYSISYSNEIGRHLIASKDLSPGEFIYKDTPAAIGPDSSSCPLCLGCFKRIVLNPGVCPECNWPMCSSSTCLNNPIHRQECKILSKLKSKITIKNFQLPNPLYDVIFPLRVLLLKEHNTDTYQHLLSLMDHAQSPLDPCTKNNREFITNFLLKKLKINATLNEINKILGVLGINSFILQEDNQIMGGLSGIYPITSLLSHACVPNIKIITKEDFSYVVQALIPIKSGSILTFNYQHYSYHLVGNLQRRLDLRTTWYFDCQCDLCQDPSEGQTCLSGIICRVCKTGIVLTQDSLDFNSDWACNKCGNVLGSSAVNAKIKELNCRLNEARNDASELDKLLVRLRNNLSVNHYLILQTKYAFVELTNFESEVKSVVSIDELHKRIGYCEHILLVVHDLFPGLSELRGYILYEEGISKLKILKYSWCRMKMSNSGYVRGLKRLEGSFEDVVKTFDGIKRSFFEGRLFLKAKADLEWVRKEISSLENAIDWESRRI